MKRLIVTGSRYQPIKPSAVTSVLQHFLDTADDEVTLIHGDAPGVDTLAAQFWVDKGPVEVFPADWDAHGKAAGPMRNQQMVDSGADVVVAFPAEGSRGTWDCVKRAHDAGIHVFTTEIKITG